MRNIGRPFTLYSDFLPSGKESRKWQYLAFGYFDGVNVGDNLFEDGEWNFEKMWQHSEKEKDILDGSYTEQTVFGFRTEEEEDESDEKFWNSGPLYGDKLTERPLIPAADSIFNVCCGDHHCFLYIEIYDVRQRNLCHRRK